MTAGRFAPTPTCDLHVGNLRTAVVAWLLARSTGRDIWLRIEDLDQARVAAAGATARRQMADLAALGLGFDGEVLIQSERTAGYADALARLETYECFCTRREIAEASQAPHAADGQRPYPGTCRGLTAADRAERAAVRPPALRVRAHAAVMTVRDRWHGEITGVVDDFVLRRNDGTFAYNLAVVVDDGLTGVDQVCRGADLLPSSPRQAWLARRLGLAVPEYAHVGLVVNERGARLAKRDGAVSLGDLRALGWCPEDVLGWIGWSLGLLREPAPTTTPALLDRFDPNSVGGAAVVWRATA